MLGTARTKEKAAAAFATLPNKAVGYSCELFQIASSVRVQEAREYFPTCAHKYFKNATRLAAIRAISIPLRAGI